MSDIPDRTILTGVSLVAFPAFAAEARHGRDLKEPFLRALGLITVVYWPALMLLVVLAHPIVALLLGAQWDGVVPLLQVMAIGSFAWFPVLLTSPVLLATGAIRDRMLADLTGRSVSAVILCSAAYFGIMAMALSKLVTIPFQMVVALSFVRRHIPFRWSELGAALWKSAAVTCGSAAGPLAIAVWSDFDLDFSLGQAAATLLAAAIGWLLGVLVIRHPIVPELMKAIGTVSGLALPAHLHHRLVTRGQSAEQV